jgi:phosphoglycolate phosphatase
MIQTVLFDLDGTLLDTAPDLAFALNQLLLEQGKPELPYSTIRPVVSHGGQALIKLGFNLVIGDKGFTELRQRLLEIYRAHLSVQTTLFPGTDELLDEIERQGLNWGVVTNKPGWLTDPLMQDLGLYQRAACVVSGDTTSKNKPDPEPMLYACNVSGSQINECIYIGDALRDIQAGKRAGMKTLAALYGYIQVNDDPENWEADGLIQHPMEVLDWINIFNAE